MQISAGELNMVGGGGLGYPSQQPSHVVIYCQIFTNYDEVVLIFDFLCILWSLLRVVAGTSEEFE